METDKSIWNGFAVCGDTKELDFIVESESYINLDKYDIISTFSDDGLNYIVSGIGGSFGEALKIAMQKLPGDIGKVSRILVHFIRGNRDVTVAEFKTISETLSNTGEDTDVRWGMAIDPSLGDDFKVILIASC